MCSFPQCHTALALELVPGTDWHTGSGNNIITIPPISCSNWQKCCIRIVYIFIFGTALLLPLVPLLLLSNFSLCVCVSVFFVSKIHYTFGSHSQSLQNQIIRLFCFIAIFVLADVSYPWWCRWYGAFFFIQKLFASLRCFLFVIYIVSAMRWIGIHTPHTHTLSSLHTRIEGVRT